MACDGWAVGRATVVLGEPAVGRSGVGGDDDMRPPSQTDNTKSSVGGLDPVRQWIVQLSLGHILLRTVQRPVWRLIVFIAQLDARLLR